MSKSKTQISTRWAVRRDFQRIVDIHNQWLPDVTEEYLIKFQRNASKPVILIAEIKEIVVAYIIYFVRSNRYEIHELVTDEKYRRQGAATVLINNLKLKLVPSQENQPQKDVYNYSMQSNSRSRISMTIEDHLLAGHLFFKSCGFTGHLTNIDAYRFEYKI